MTPNIRGRRGLHHPSHEHPRLALTPETTAHDAVVYLEAHGPFPIQTWHTTESRHSVPTGTPEGGSDFLNFRDIELPLLS